MLNLSLCFANKRHLRVNRPPVQVNTILLAEKSAV